MKLHIHGRVIPEDNEKDLYIVDGHITLKKVKDAKTVVKNGYIIPGLVDAHAHLSISSPAGDDASPQEAVEKIGYYLSHDDERGRIRYRGSELVKAKFSSKVRVKELMILIDRMKKGDYRKWNL